MDAKKTMKALNNGQVAYEKIVDKEIHYVYLKNRQYHELVFKPHKRNFMHLCGIKYKNPKTGRNVKPLEFYDLLKLGGIDFKGLRKDVFTNQKLDVLDQLSLLLTCNLKIVDQRTTYLNIDFTHGIRTRKNIFCLALEHEIENNSAHFVPLSLLNLRGGPKGNTIKGKHPVDCIYIVDRKSQNNPQIVCKTDEFKEYEKINTYVYKTVHQGTV